MHLSNEMRKMVQKCTFIAWERHPFCRSVCVLMMSGGVGLCSNRQTESQRVSGSGSDELFRCVLCLSDTSITTRGVTECIGPRGLALDRLAIGNTGTFHLRSGPIAETRESSPILGTIFTLQRMGNRIKQIPQKLEAVLPDASASRTSKQSGISHPQAGFN